MRFFLKADGKNMHKLITFLICFFLSIKGFCSKQDQMQKMYSSLKKIVEAAAKTAQEKNFAYFKILHCTDIDKDDLLSLAFDYEFPREMILHNITAYPYQILINCYHSDTGEKGIIKTKDYQKNIDLFFKEIQEKIFQISAKTTREKGFSYFKILHCTAGFGNSSLAMTSNYLPVSGSKFFKIEENPFYIFIVCYKTLEKGQDIIDIETISSYDTNPLL